MYRTPKKTTRRTEYKCLKCKHIKPDTYKIESWGCMVECLAPNRCFMSKFNAKDYFCVEHKSLNEMSKSEQDRYRDKVQKDYQKKEFKLWAYKYHPKKQAKKLVEEWKEKNK